MSDPLLLAELCCGWSLRLPGLKEKCFMLSRCLTLLSVARSMSEAMVYRLGSCFPEDAWL